GFLVNRLLLPYMSEATELLLEGASAKSVDRAAESFGMPMGPIHLYDVVGLDVARHAGQTMLDSFPDRVIASPLIVDLVNAGRLGQKSGSGFYSYDNKKRRPQTDPQLETFLNARRKGDREIAADELVDRLFLPMLLEATRVLEERVVRDARDVDLGLIFGIGFPPFKGGLLFWADTLGAAGILERLKPYEALGPRYQPTGMLVEMARTGATFYGSSG
ncbi:MAG: 3-hydroxyacyl-CoA dehydrogenase family protein, partial [Planctomycetales bacterium]